MRKLKHLPLELWPQADHEAFRTAYEPGDIFDESCGPGAHHSAKAGAGWSGPAYRRWLGFLAEYYPDDLLKPPAERITPERLRAFIEHLSTEVRATTVAMTVAHLYCAAGLIAPGADWRWLASVKARLAARAKPENRFDRLVPGWQTLDLGIELMDEASTLPDTGISSGSFSIVTGSWWRCSACGSSAAAASLRSPSADTSSSTPQG